MTLALGTDLSGMLHRLLTRHAHQTRNKEVARRLVESAGAGRCDSVLAEDDRVTVRVADPDGGEPAWRLVELRFDPEGRVVEQRDFPLARRGAAGTERSR
ncbi:hypothetical protein [Streptomyces mangrovisoli]|uniref:SnoaL-like domain-containing protein n=1 Tax=Streptomyces mangrovisoli TaxID=1428628 RepID=A0A1J4P0S4_9ACTN|nr:hypothetical protein [Streptomyces mangrovisoli]OIJ68219.1 hypothetical protein WN71_009280 [Streptomyces mangrovisoli]